MDSRNSSTASSPSLLPSDEPPSSRRAERRKRGARIPRSVLLTALVFLWALETVGIYVLAIRLAGGGVDLGSTDDLRLILFLPVWTGVAVVGTVLVRTEW